jgi:ATP-dependent DNA ligase
VDRYEFIEARANLGMIAVRERPLALGEEALLAARLKRLRPRALDLLQSVIGAGNNNLRFSEEFADPLKLLQVSERMGLEGIVSKRTEQPYVSGKNRAG